MPTNLFPPSEDLITLTEYFRDQKPGTELSYTMIEDDTGVAMDLAGKDKMRRAILRAGHAGHRPAPPGGGWGIVIASADDALPETGRRWKKVLRGIFRAGQYASRQISRNGREMTNYVRERMELSVIGAKAMGMAAKKEQIAVVDRTTQIPPELPAKPQASSTPPEKTLPSSVYPTPPIPPPS